MKVTDERLDQKGLYHNVIRVAVPIALQSLIGSSLNLVDNLMVGSLGDSQLAAVGVSIQVYFVFWMIIYGFSSGCSTFMAQFWGAGDIKSIRKTIGFTVMVAFVIGLVFFSVSFFRPDLVLRIFTDKVSIIQDGMPYVKTGAPCFLFISISLPFEVSMRATQQTRIPLLINMIVFGVNTLLNYMLIFGNFGAPALGVAGSALATSIARGIQFCLMMYMVFGRKNIIAGHLKEFFGWKKVLASKIVKNAIPTTINETMWGLGSAMYIAAYARIGVVEFASVQAANVIQNLLQLAAFSVGDAILILVGQKLGEGKLEQAYIMAKRLLVLGIGIGLVAGALLILLAKPIVSLFNFSPEGSKYAFYILLVYGGSMGIILYNGNMIVGVLRCGGDTKFAMMTEVGTVWLIGVPTAFITSLVFHWPIYWVVLAVKMEEIVKAAILTKRFLSKKWVKKIVDD